MELDQGHRETDQILKKLERRLNREYKSALKTMDERLSKHLSRFQETDAKMIEKWRSGEISEKDYLQWRLQAMTSGKWWQGTRDALAKDLTNTNQIAAQMINHDMPDVYVLNMNYGTYEIENGTNLNTSFSLYDRNTVERLMSDNPDMIPKAGTDIPKDMRWNRKKITSAVMQGVLTGDSIPKIAKRLQQVTDMSAKAAIRNARTYTTAAENRGRVDSYERAKSLGIDLQQEWMATLDVRTRTSHRHLDGVRIEVGGKFPNKCRYPGDPEGRPEEIYNCRCTLVAALAKYQEKADRFSRLPKGMTYDEWKGKKEEGVAGLSFADRVAGVLNEAKQSNEGITTDVIHKVGRIFADDLQAEYIDPINAEFDKAQTEFDKVKSKIDLEEYHEYSWKKRRGSQVETIPEFEEYEEARKKLTNARSALYNVDNHVEYMKRKIGEVRDVGFDADDADTIKKHLMSSRSPMRKIVEKAYNGYPSEWVERSVIKGRLEVKKVQRGYYDGFTIAISGDGESSYLETAFHELGHRFEASVPGILQQEREFYKRRTEGEELEWLGTGYAKYEKTRRDNFLHSYMGKDYGRDDTYELVSMGFQYAYTDPIMLSKDKDMQEWILGMLLSV